MLSIVLGALDLLPCLPSVLIWASMVSWSIAANSESLGYLCLWSLNGLLGGLLLVAGIHLLRRKRAAIVHLHYAVLKLICIAILMVIVFWTLAGVGRSVGPASQFRLEHQAGLRRRATLYAAAITGFVLLVAYPAFLLVWFSRPVIRRQLRAWGEPKQDEVPPGQTGSSQGGAP